MKTFLLPLSLLGVSSALTESEIRSEMVDSVEVLEYISTAIQPECEQITSFLDIARKELAKFPEAVLTTSKIDDSFGWDCSVLEYFGYLDEVSVEYCSRVVKFHEIIIELQGILEQEGSNDRAVLTEAFRVVVSTGLFNYSYIGSLVSAHPGFFGPGQYGYVCPISRAGRWIGNIGIDEEDEYNIDIPDAFFEAVYYFIPKGFQGIQNQAEVHMYPLLNVKLLELYGEFMNLSEVRM